MAKEQIISALLEERYNSAKGDEVLLIIIS